jgi:hypothetical protein
MPQQVARQKNANDLVVKDTLYFLISLPYP